MPLWILAYVIVIHKKAISKEKLTKRGLVSPLEYYLRQHTLKLN